MELDLIPTLYKRYFLSPLGLNRANSIVFWLLILFSVIAAGGLWLFQGNIAAVTGIILVIAIVFLTFLRLDLSLYFFLSLVLIFDQFGIPEFDPITHRAAFFRNLKEISYLPTVPGGVFNPIELFLVLLTTSLLFVLAVKKDFKWQRIPVIWPFLLFLGSLIFSLVYGMQKGGDFLAALWEVRALFYFSLMYLIVPQIVQSKKQVKIVFWIAIFAVTFKAFQGVGRFINLGFTTGGLQTLTNHEDPIFMVSLFLLLLGTLVFGVKSKQKRWLLLFLLPLLLGFYVAQRRAAYATLLVSLAIFVLLLPEKKFWKFVKYSVPFVLVGMLYFTSFWNYNGTLGRPVQMIKSGFETPTIEENYQDYKSNLYREYENYNLAQTFVSAPIIGIGFGKEYKEVLSLPKLTFELQYYIPHNQIYWVIVKMGLIGFFAFWFFFNAYAAKGVKIIGRLKDNYLKVVMMVIIAAIIGQMVVSFFDLQLTYYRNMIFLATLMGLMPALENNLKKEAEKNGNG